MNFTVDYEVVYSWLHCRSSERDNSDMLAYTDKVACVYMCVLQVHTKTESPWGRNNARHIRSQSRKFVKCHDKGQWVDGKFYFDANRGVRYKGDMESICFHWWWYIWQGSQSHTQVCDLSDLCVSGVNEAKWNSLSTLPWEFIQQNSTFAFLEMYLFERESTVHSRGRESPSRLPTEQGAQWGMSHPGKEPPRYPRVWYHTPLPGPRFKSFYLLPFLFMKANLSSDPNFQFCILGLAYCDANHRVVGVLQSCSLESCPQAGLVLNSCTFSAACVETQLFWGNSKGGSRKEPQSLTFSRDSHPWLSPCQHVGQKADGMEFSHGTERHMPCSGEAEPCSDSQLLAELKYIMLTGPSGHLSIHEIK